MKLSDLSDLLYLAFISLLFLVSWPIMRLIDLIERKDPPHSYFD